MTMDGQNYTLPGKLAQYLATLNRLYERRGENLLRQIVVNADFCIHEGWDYDGWNGGTYGHAVTLSVPEDLFLEIVERREESQNRIARDLNSLDNSQNEHISAVFIEMMPDANHNWREESGLLRTRRSAPPIAPDDLQRIWGSGHVRLFLSHKSTVKEQTAALKKSFARCGITAFVAHEDIEPTEEWLREIERALFSMDALVALLTEDFDDSPWTDQEVGVAIGRCVPLITVRLGCDPYGLMGKGQALRGCSWSNKDDIAAKVFGLLHKRMHDKRKLFECALSAYAASIDWEDSAWKIKHLFTPFETLTPDQITRVLDTYNANHWNHDSFNGMSVLKPLLEKWTHRPWKIVNNELKPVEEDAGSSGPSEWGEVPF